MSYGRTGDAFRTGTATAADITDGVLGRRFFAYLIDMAVIFLLVVLFGLLVAVAGVFTFGLGFALYGILVPAVALLYSAATVGGTRQGTVGMRLLDLAVVRSADGGPVGFWPAFLHAGLFYLAAGTTLLVVSVLIGFVRPDGRFGHDLLTGVLAVRRGGLR